MSAVGYAQVGYVDLLGLRQLRRGAVLVAFQHLRPAVRANDSLEEGRIDKRGEPSELSLLWEVKLKSDFRIAKAAFDPRRTSCLPSKYVRFYPLGFRDSAMKRREFIGVIGGAAATWTLSARAQQRQQGLPVLGYLALSSLDNPSGPFPAALGALKQAGFEVGQALGVETRYANFQLDQIPALAAELVNLPCTVIITSGGPGPALTLQSLTSTIPIVFAPLPDPVRSGLVASLNRPGANITGVAAMTIELDPKRIELLHELTKAPGSFGVMYNPTRPDTKIQIDSIQTAAKAVGRELVLAQASSPQQIDAAFALFNERSIVGTAGFGRSILHRSALADCRARHTARLAHDISMARIRGYRRLRELRIEFDGAIPAGRIFRCAHSQG